ncbi:chitinase-3-like protein 1 [Penaeus chinensis]|uniref:chitinase-3-like protein 1 n=1 Tax=Penaeus chinensis TaxID=139456 RepID=UPI001FB8219F|nr:chitinase-3-like protein 1 [Penaeus chinensis]
MRVFVLLALFTVGAQSFDNVICYFGSWSVWRPGDGKFDVEDIDPFLCTHVIFGFAGLSNHTWEIEVLDPWNELCPDESDIGNNCAFNRFTDLKKINPALKTILAVGGWNEGSEDYSVMAMDPEKRKTFIESSIELVRKHNFDGLDVDWEYPAARGGVPEDKENFVTLLKEFRARFDTFSPPLLLSGALSPGKPTIDDGYDVPGIAENLDMVHVMGYDYHGTWENFTHHNAPICSHYLDEGVLQYFNVEFTVEYYLSLGLPKDKMVLGIPVYGRCFTLDDIEENGFYAPAHKPGPAGPYIRIPGTLGANEICERLRDDKTCKIVHDPSMHEPYFYCTSDKIWCGFDDADSVYLKARYARNMGLAGVMAWTIDTDDFKPSCYDEKFHIIHNMKRAIAEEPGNDTVVCVDYFRSTTEEPTTTTPEPTTTTPEPTTTTPEPTTTTPEPITTTPQPIITTPEPITTTSEPTPLSTAVPTITTLRPVSTTRNPALRPDCTNHADGTTFIHEDCNKYWVCINGYGVLEMCAPGTLFDPSLSSCNWEDAVDTSSCNLWICEVDNTYYPHADCDKYYWCYNGEPHVEVCPNGLFWNQLILQCDNPVHVDTSSCNIP